MLDKTQKFSLLIAGIRHQASSIQITPSGLDAPQRGFIALVSSFFRFYPIPFFSIRAGDFSKCLLLLDEPVFHAPQPFAVAQHAVFAQKHFVMALFNSKNRLSSTLKPNPKLTRFPDPDFSPSSREDLYFP